MKLPDGQLYSLLREYEHQDKHSDQLGTLATEERKVTRHNQHEKIMEESIMKSIIK